MTYVLVGISVAGGIVLGVFAAAAVMLMQGRDLRQ